LQAKLPYGGSVMGEAYLELIRSLESAGVHHGRPRYLGKQEMYDILMALYGVARNGIETYPTDTGEQTKLPMGPGE